MKVLLFSNDLLPYPGLPTSGGGLRCYQLQKGLESRGIEVVVSMPGFTYLAEKYSSTIPDELKAFFWTYETQDKLLREVKPDAVIFASNWDHYNLQTKPACPLIIDLHGSRLIETALWGTPVSPERKVQVLSQADCLLSAGQRQRLYFYGWLLQAGRIPEDEHFIRYIPISLSPDLPEHDYSSALKGEPHLVSGGGWFPWQNQATAIHTIASTVEKLGHGSLSIYGTPHARQGGSGEEEQIREIFNGVQALAQKSSRISVHDYVSREELLRVYRSASAAVEIMRYNLERELAFTTRTIEYLWCGLPVFYNNYGEIAEHIAEYDAGWTLNPDSEDDIRSAVEQAISNPELFIRKGANAQRLVREKFTWDKTIEPLVAFLEHPQILSAGNPIIGAVSARPSFLSVRGKKLSRFQLSAASELEQSYIVPAEDICGLEIPVYCSAEGPTKLLTAVENSSGRKITKREFLIPQLTDTGSAVYVCRVDFPLLRRPSGGANLRLKVTNLDNKQLELVATSGAVYPWTSGSSGDALTVSFIPGEGSDIFRFKILFRRAARLVVSGQWRRVLRACRKRIPELLVVIQKRFLARA